MRKGKKSLAQGKMEEWVEKEKPWKKAEKGIRI
jgi:hypothetical protein